MLEHRRHPDARCVAAPERRRLGRGDEADEALLDDDEEAELGFLAPGLARHPLVELELAERAPHLGDAHGAREASR